MLELYIEDYITWNIGNTRLLNVAESWILLRWTHGVSGGMEEVAMKVPYVGQIPHTTYLAHIVPIIVQISHQAGILIPFAI